MKHTVFLAECMDKIHHAEDRKTVHRLSVIPDIDDIFETHVRYQNQEYCIAAISLTDKKHHKELAQIIKNDPNIKSVTLVDEDKTPFLTP